MLFSKTLLASLAACALTSGVAVAAAHPPAKPVTADFYSGRWYEIARTPNAGQRNCQAPATDFTARGASFAVRQVCHRGSPLGPEKVFTTSGRILPDSQNTRFTLSFLGGLKKQEYWVLDHAADGSWAIMATPGGNYVWLISRTPDMPTSTKAVALERVKDLGYQKLELPQHPPGAGV
jgi:apolipoprotein D and lipocalin family protein